MELRDYKIGDEHAIIALFELVFKQTMSLEQWQWRFTKNPAGNYKIKLMWEGDQLVGHYAVSPVNMIIDGTQVLTAHSLTTMTHPDFGGRGIFKKLSLALYDDLENKFGCKAVWGFPNNNSHFGFVNSLGWSDISVIHTLGLNMDKVVKSGLNLNITTFNSFTSEQADFINSRLKKHFKVFVERSEAYLNWRFYEKPAVVYKKFEVLYEGKRGIIVTKVYPSSIKDVFDLNIVECHLEDYSMLHDCIAHIINSYQLNFNRITIWKNLFDKDHLLLEKIGFVPVLPQTYLGARIHHTMPVSFENHKNWYFAMGDSDVF